MLKPVPEFKKSRHLSVNIECTVIGDYDSREDLQQRGFSRPVLPYYTERLAIAHFKRDIIKRNKILMVFFPENDLP